MLRQPQYQNGSVYVSLPRGDLLLDNILDEEKDNVDGAFHAQRIGSGVYLLTHTSVMTDTHGNRNDLIDRLEDVIDEMNQLARA